MSEWITFTTHTSESIPEDASVTGGDLYVFRRTKVDAHGRQHVRRELLPLSHKAVCAALAVARKDEAE